MESDKAGGVLLLLGLITIPSYSFFSISTSSIFLFVVAVIANIAVDIAVISIVITVIVIAVIVIAIIVIVIALIVIVVIVIVVILDIGSATQRSGV